MTQCEHPAGKCNNADDCAEHICAQPKQKPTLLWDLIDPGWREREVEHYIAASATCKPASAATCAERSVFGDDAWKWAQRLLIVGAALALIGCAAVVRWVFGT